MQWLAIAATIGGAVISARFSAGEQQDAFDAGQVRRTVLVATAACGCYAGFVILGQMAAQTYGELQTVWAGRIVAILALLPVFAVAGGSTRKAGRSGALFLVLLVLQGLLDIGGHLFLFAGSFSAQPHIVAVVASCFGAVTTLLGYLVLREHVSLPQWSGIALVFGGVVALSAFTPH